MNDYTNAVLGAIREDLLAAAALVADYGDPDFAVRMVGCTHAEVLTALEEVGHEFHGNQWSDRPGKHEYYHGSSKANLNSILKKGLLLSKAGKNWDISGHDHVYVTRSAKEAGDWAKQAIGDGKHDAVVFKIHIPESESNKIIGKGRVWTKERAFQGDIKPEWIVGHKFVSRNAAAGDGGDEFYIALNLDAVGDLIPGDLETLEEVGHEFHGNQWTSARADVIEHGKATGKERLVVIDPQGQRIDDVLGSSIGFGQGIDPKNYSPEFNKQLSNPDSHLTLVHNHPEGQSVSGGDIGELRHVGIKTIEAVTHEGSTFAISRGPSFDAEKIDKLYTKAYSNARESLLRSRDAGSLKHSQVDLLVDHAVAEGLSQKGVLRYESHPTGNYQKLLTEKASEYKRAVKAATSLSRKLETLEHSFSSTQVNLPEPLRTEVINYPIDPDDIVERELTPHVTVKYGLHTSSPADVAALLEKVGPIRVVLGLVSVFETSMLEVAAEFDESKHPRNDKGQFGASYFARNPRLAAFSSIPVVRSEGTGSRHPEAEVAGGKIHLYPKFDRLSPDQQDFVFAHEVGHAVLDQKGLPSLVTDAEALGIDVWDTAKLPFGQSNMHEAFAEAFASYHTDGEVVSRYPAWAKLVKQYAKTGLKTAESNSDVLKIDVISDDLEYLNELLSSLPHTDTHPTYQPHVTLAYVVPGSGAKYVGDSTFAGREFIADEIVFSDQDDNTIAIRTLAGGRGSDAPRDSHGRYGPGKSSKFESHPPHGDLEYQNTFRPKGPEGYATKLKGADLVWHGTTTEALASIKEHGLIPHGGKGADAYLYQNFDPKKYDLAVFTAGDRALSVYVTHDIRQAHEFSNYATEVSSGKSLILAIEIPKEHQSRIVKDEQDVQALRIKGSIPPEWIRRVDNKGNIVALLQHVLSGGNKTVYVVVYIPETLETLAGGRGPDAERDNRGRYGPGGGGAKKTEEKVIKVKGKLPPGLIAYLEKKKAEKAAGKTEVVKVEKVEPPVEVIEHKAETKSVPLTVEDLKIIRDNYAPRRNGMPEDTSTPTSLLKDGQRSQKDLVLNERTERLAIEMGYDPDRIDVVDLDHSRTFILGGQQLTEAGHYNPSTGRVQLNTQNIGSNPYGVIVHEIAHAQFDYAEMQRDHEIAALTSVMPRYGDTRFDQRSEIWTKSGYIRANKIKDVLEANPAIKAFYDAGLTPHIFEGKMDLAAIRKDDGVSNYSRQWWDEANRNDISPSGKTEGYYGQTTRSAINETLSETARLQRYHTQQGDKPILQDSTLARIKANPSSYHISNINDYVSPRFLKFRDDIQKIYRTKDQKIENREINQRNRLAEMFKK